MATTTISPGTNNAISTAFASMSNGDAFILEAGEYPQSETISIPTSVTRFSLTGKGPGISKIRYTADVDGISQTMTIDAYRMDQVLIQGITFQYDYNKTDSTKTCINYGEILTARK